MCDTVTSEIWQDQFLESLSTDLFEEDNSTEDNSTGDSDCESMFAFTYSSNHAVTFVDNEVIKYTSILCDKTVNSNRSNTVTLKSILRKAAWLAS